MTAKKVFLGMIGLTTLLSCLVVAGVVLGSNMLKSKARTLMTAKLENRVLEEQQVALVKANKDIVKYADLEKIAKTIVPQDKDQARTVREIISLAEESNVKIATISFPASNLGQAQPKVVTPAEGDKTATTPVTPAAPPITQVKAVDGIPGVYQLEINIQSDSNTPTSYLDFIAFLTKIEQSRRTAQITNINVQPSTSQRDKVTFGLAINVFIKP